MPYNPGVQDISGQLRAQGIAQAGQAWSQAIGNIGKSVTDAMQTYKQNQYLTNQALGKFTAATQADPSLLKFLESGGEQEDPNAPKFPVSPELLKSWSKVKEGKPLDVRDAAMLGTMADTWVKTKAEAAQQQHLIAQTNVANAQVADIQNQAALRNAQVAALKRKEDIMRQFMGGADTGQAQPSAAPSGAVSGPSGSQAEGGPTSLDELTQRASKGLPSANVMDRHPYFAPTSKAPEPRDAVVTLMRSGVDPFEHPEIAVQLHKDNYDRWFNTERPIGYVAGGQETDKDGNRVNLYYQVVNTNGGTIKQSKEPLKVYEGHPAPGIVLDGTTFMPNEASKLAFQTSQNQGNQLLAQNPAPLTKKAKDEIEAAANDIQSIKVGLAQLERMKAINEEMKAKRWAGTSGITGSDLVNKYIEPLVGDTTGIDFNSLASSFKADVMSTAKNVRNVYEFKALTGNIPDAQQPPKTRDQNLQMLEERLRNQLNRNLTAINLMQKGADPDSAYAHATLSDLPKEDVAKAPGVGEQAAKQAKKAESPKASKPSSPPVVVTQADYDKLEPGQEYTDSKGNVRIKGGKK